MSWSLARIWPSNTSAVCSTVTRSCSWSARIVRTPSSAPTRVSIRSAQLWQCIGTCSRTVCAPSWPAGSVSVTRPLARPRVSSGFGRWRFVGVLDVVGLLWGLQAAVIVLAAVFLFQPILR